jgi:hypothetical protein
MPHGSDRGVDQIEGKCLVQLSMAIQEAEQDRPKDHVGCQVIINIENDFATQLRAADNGMHELAVRSHKRIAKGFGKARIGLGFGDQGLEHGTTAL